MSRNTNAFQFIIKGVTTPGTAEQLAQNFIPDGLATVITARDSNSGNMYIGNSQANAQGVTTRKVLIPGQSISLHVDRTDLIWVDADNANDRLEISVEKPT